MCWLFLPKDKEDSQHKQKELRSRNRVPDSVCSQEAGKDQKEDPQKYKFAVNQYVSQAVSADGIKIRSRDPAEGEEEIGRAHV